MADSRELYLTLLKKSLTNFVYGPAEGAFDAAARAEGKDLPPTAHTMVGVRRLDALQYCIKRILFRGVPGDLVEAGAWRGGTSIFMRAVLKAFGVRHRNVWVADSFEGMPEPDAQKYPADAGSVPRPEFAVSLEQVRTNFESYGLLDAQVHFLKGFFRDTLPPAPIRQVSLLVVDAGSYQSTMNALESLCPKLSPGGIVFVSDYAVEASRKAVDDYRRVNGIQEELQSVDWSGMLWQRPGPKKEPPPIPERPPSVYEVYGIERDPIALG
jgi:Macrocin-O-methyltransferase (TylF)